MHCLGSHKDVPSSLCNIVQNILTGYNFLFLSAIHHKQGWFFCLNHLQVKQQVREELRLAIVTRYLKIRFMACSSVTAFVHFAAKDVLRGLLSLFNSVSSET